MHSVGLEMSLEKFLEFQQRKISKTFQELPPAGLRLPNLGLVLGNVTSAECTPQVVQKYRFHPGTRGSHGADFRNERSNLLPRTLHVIVLKHFMVAQSRPPLRIALIGMSGSGKSFWSKRLALAGHASICCDDRIEERLRSRLEVSGYTGINGVASWMGWPDSATYAQREAEYLVEEIAVLDELLTELERDRSRELILDTTGSVIYTGNNLLLRLRRQMTIVYLAAATDEQQLLIERYLNDPKPVLWRGAFQPKKGETARQTVERCYPTLIAGRRQSYEALAHCNVPVAELRDREVDPVAFLAKIKVQLERTK
jgi:shikimate kinase